MFLVDTNERLALGEKIRRAMAEKQLGREDVQAALAGRGVEVSVKTISNITNGNHAGRPETLLAMADILGIAVEKSQPDAQASSSLFERLALEADAAQQEYERAVNRVLVAEKDLDRASTRVFRYLALRNNIEAAGRDKAATSGRELTAAEYLAIDGVPRPSMDEIAELVATHAEFDDHVLTRWEVALLEALNPNHDYTAGHPLLDMTRVRESVRAIDFSTWVAPPLHVTAETAAGAADNLFMRPASVVDQMLALASNRKYGQNVQNAIRKHAIRVGIMLESWAFAEDDKRTLEAMRLLVEAENALIGASGVDAVNALKAVADYLTEQLNKHVPGATKDAWFKLQERLQDRSSYELAANRSAPEPFNDDTDDGA